MAVLGAFAASGHSPARQCSSCSITDLCVVQPCNMVLFSAEELCLWKKQHVTQREPPWTSVAGHNCLHPALLDSSARQWTGGAAAAFAQEQVVSCTCRLPTDGEVSEGTTRVRGPRLSSQETTTRGQLATGSSQVRPGLWTTALGFRLSSNGHQRTAQQLVKAQYTPSFVPAAQK